LNPATDSHTPFDFQAHTKVMAVLMGRRFGWPLLDWRWQRVELAHPWRIPRRLRTPDDRWVQRARRFYATLQRNQEDWRGLLHSRGHQQRADLLEAYRIRHDLGIEPAVRWEIEARILAGQDDDAIARHGLASPAAVAAYEALFFDVRYRLDPPNDWVVFSTVGPDLHTGNLRNCHRLLSWIALALGPFVLDGVVSVMFDRPVGGFQPDPEETLSAQFIVAYHRYESEVPLWIKLMELFHQYIQNQRFESKDKTAIERNPELDAALARIRGPIVLRPGPTDGRLDEGMFDMPWVENLRAEVA
jgi:hypothetical protein